MIENPSKTSTIQNWNKLGRLFPIDKTNAIQYAAVPLIGKIECDIATIYFSNRNQNNKSELCSIKINMNTFLATESVKLGLLQPGKIGEFDEDGVMACDIYEIENKKYLTYIGWNRGVSVPFRNAIGIAKYENDSFTKLFNGPVLDRSIYDPCFVASNCVINIDGTFIMYYLSCINWDEINGQLTHYYNIKIAKSDNGINWIPTGNTAINFRYTNEYAISVPRVLIENNLYKMWYSYRGGPHSETYRIGYAESEDGFNWIRKDECVNLNTSKDDWDSDMLCYPFIFKHNDNTYMLYNGNGYGKTGFGIAKLEK